MLVPMTGFTVQHTIIRILNQDMKDKICVFCASGKPGLAKRMAGIASYQQPNLRIFNIWKGGERKSWGRERGGGRRRGRRGERRRDKKRQKRKKEREEKEKTIWENRSFLYLNSIGLLQRILAILTLNTNVSLKYDLEFSKDRDYSKIINSFWPG